MVRDAFCSCCVQKQGCCTAIWGALLIMCTCPPPQARDWFGNHLDEATTVYKANMYWTSRTRTQGPKRKYQFLWSLVRAPGQLRDIGFAVGTDEEGIMQPKRMVPYWCLHINLNAPPPHLRSSWTCAAPVLWWRSSGAWRGCRRSAGWSATSCAPACSGSPATPEVRAESQQAGGLAGATCSCPARGQEGLEA